jgi:hypothetical protein
MSHRRHKETIQMQLRVDESWKDSSKKQRKQFVSSFLRIEDWESVKLHGIGCRLLAEISQVRGMRLRTM